MKKTVIFYDEAQQMRVRFQELANKESQALDTYGVPYNTVHEYVQRLTGQSELDSMCQVAVELQCPDDKSNGMITDFTQMHFVQSLITNEFLDVAKGTLFKKRKNALEHEEEFLTFFSHVCQLIFCEDDATQNLCTQSELEAYMDFFGD